LNTVEIRPSLAGAGDGLYVRRDLNPKTVVAFYNGVRIPKEVGSDTPLLKT